MRNQIRRSNVGATEALETKEAKRYQEPSTNYCTLTKSKGTQCLPMDEETSDSSRAIPSSLSFLDLTQLFLH